MGYRLVAKKPEDKKFISQLENFNYAILDFNWKDYKRLMKTNLFNVIKRKDKIIILPKGKVKIKKRNKSTYEIDVMEFFEFFI